MNGRIRFTATAKGKWIVAILVLAALVGGGRTLMFRTIQVAADSPAGILAQAGSVHLAYISDADLREEGITLRTPATEAIVTEQQTDQVAGYFASHYGASSVR